MTISPSTRFASDKLGGETSQTRTLLHIFMVGKCISDAVVSVWNPNVLDMHEGAELRECTVPSNRSLSVAANYSAMLPHCQGAVRRVTTKTVI